VSKDTSVFSINIEVSWDKYDIPDDIDELAVRLQDSAKSVVEEHTTNADKCSVSWFYTQS
jgi:hypothetical protein